ncbi:hypothetical protein ERICIV_04634 (plasmid) [Paenibacillus larvae subsp. larvae]|uniref:Uncharacterized protein n=1 Tax=Paenibacillus larvae subsp. larvae TaxID=147375 RepID=A0A2L1UKD6_9BACL|nr:hypothetical protein [Paenibacillus larvae]AQZ49368.1 hypothetical protein B5S25_22970 [Paenibacillus larvae subsp. pulvifaciens]AVF29015.1 hypothetical protein ERICIII_05015 [Paenibacillus larvae subsp. larvae]AVF33396.1 hypothetical protein ERICIV_04634 [Paenibacillus larvae subsp. larvae]MCY7518863.1 hypothetical protein [Paenibacillus larvae]MCY9500586.1 hypothetical protein [Paenibacillus larvae]
MKGVYSKMVSCIKQTGPTCGIYALLNGIYTINPINPTKKKTDEIVYHILTENVMREDTDNKQRKTFVGEFFDFDIFKEFVLNNVSFINKKINCDSITYSVEIKDIMYLEDQDLIQSIQNHKAFVLFSIPGIYFSPKKHMASHWITISDYDIKKLKYIVSDSRYKKARKYSLKGLKKRNERLRGATFFWRLYKYISFLPKKRNTIKHLIRSQVRKKQDFLNKGMLKNEVKHTANKMIVIQKLYTSTTPAAI